jgi:hypothetical protein
MPFWSMSWRLTKSADLTDGRTPRIYPRWQIV